MARSVLINEAAGPQAGQGRWMLMGALISLALGLLSCFVPAYWIAAGLLSIVAFVWLVSKPTRPYYLTIFTIPFTDRVRVFPVSFSLNEIFILMTIVVCLVHAYLSGKRVSLRTPIDVWMILLMVMFFLAGLFSAGDTGLLGAGKIFEGFLFYYVTVYFLRTRQITRSMVLKWVLWAAVSQSLLGTFQSITGIGSNHQSPRGYLGYLGLGSNLVWQGRGTTWHFNTLGNYLTMNAALFMPLFIFYMRKNNPLPWLYGFIVMLGVITTYSRGSLLGVIAAVLFLLAVSQRSLIRSLVYTGIFLPMVILPGIWLSDSGYTRTLNYEIRLSIWEVTWAAITSSTKTFFLGSGLNSYEVAAWPFIPASVKLEDYHFWFAHNFYLLTVLEVGFIGAIILFGFLGYACIDCWLSFRRNHGWQSGYALAISAMIISVFFVSIFDHTLSSPCFKVFIFLILGLFYGRRNTSHA